jgi:multidrug efflux pump subunit AcrA (membrane-fusion protein)
LRFKIDEVVTVQGQLQSIGGSVDLKSPVGGKVASVFFKDGAKVRKDKLPLCFDTRQAADEQRTLKQLIGLEEQGLQSRLSTIDSQRQILAARLLKLVPQAGLFAEVFVPNKDIGFVKTGQEAKVRVDASPFTRYGELEGKVTQIGADALEPDAVQNFYRFPVKLELDRPYLESQGTRIPLRSDMAITTNLKLREKRVISLISDLLVDQTDSVKSIRQQ